MAAQPNRVRPDNAPESAAPKTHPAIPTPEEMLARLRDNPIDWAAAKAANPTLYSHSEYLATPLWKKIRGRVLRRDKRKCVRCGARAGEVHHRSYAREVLEGNADHLLVSLCRGCHEVVEFDESGRKRTHEERERILATPAPTAIPDVVIKGKKRAKLLPPAGASRMSAAQLADYYGRGLEAMRQTSALARAKDAARRERVRRDPIDSNLYLTDQIVWVLNWIFENKPTAYIDFSCYLPDQIVDNPSYWLKQAGDLLVWHNAPCRSVAKRVFTARPEAIQQLRDKLAEGDRMGWNPLKERPMLIQGAYAKHPNARP